MLLGVQRLAPPPAIGGQVAKTAQGGQVVAAALQDQPIEGRGFVGAAEAPGLLGPLEQLDGGRIVGLGVPAPAYPEEALEREAERQERADRGRQRHGRGESWKEPGGSAAPGTVSPWPSAPLPRSPAGSRCSDARRARLRAVSRRWARCTARTIRTRHRRASAGRRRRREAAA